MIKMSSQYYFVDTAAKLFALLTMAHRTDAWKRITSALSRNIRRLLDIGVAMLLGQCGAVVGCSFFELRAEMMA